MAIAILFIFLNLNPTQGRTLKQHAREFDFIGLGLMIGGVVCLLIGFNASETNCAYHPRLMRVEIINRLF